MWGSQEENRLTVSALGAVDRHAGYLRPFAGGERRRSEPERSCTAARRVLTSAGE